jgi:hypothetical protein
LFVQLDLFGYQSLSSHNKHFLPKKTACLCLFLLRLFPTPMDIPQSFVSRFSENPNQPEKILESMDDQEADEVADWYLEVMAKIV